MSYGFGGAVVACWIGRKVTANPRAGPGAAGPVRGQETQSRGGCGAPRAGHLPPWLCEEVKNTLRDIHR